MKNTIKRVLCFMLAALLLLPTIAMSVMATDVEYEITTQPTSENPTVTLNDSEGATYQWYEASSGEITDKNAEPFSSFPIPLQGEASYSAVNGWTPAYFEIQEGIYYNLYFAVDIYEGEELHLSLSDDEILQISIVDVETLGTMSPTVTKTEDGCILSDITASKAGLVIISTTNEITVKAEIPSRRSLGDTVEGQTTDTLTAFELDKKYACKITYEDGTELISDIISYIPDITSQPTVDDPSVEVNIDDYATYKWYNLEYDYNEVNLDNAQVFNGTLINVTGSSSYDSENGWTPLTVASGEEAYYYYFIINLKKGDKLKILREEEDSENYVLATVNSPNMLYADENNEFQITETNSYVLVTENGSGAGLKAQVYNSSVGEEITGQESAGLTEYEPNKSYICKVIWTKGEQVIEKYSNELVMEYKILEHPTSSKPTIKVNFSDLIQKYEWYGATDGEYEITDENSTVSSGASYNKDSGWQGTSSARGTEYFTLALSEGDIITLTHSAGEISESNIMFTSNSSDIYGEYNDDGEIIFEVEKNGEYLLISNPAYLFTDLKVMCNGVTISDEVIENQITDTLTEYEIGEVYFAKVTYKDGTELTSKALLMEYAITTQPSEENPTVETNRDGDVKEYRWYKVDISDYYEVLILDEIEIYGKIYPYVYYGSYENGKWTSSDGYINLYMTLKKGDTVVVTPNEGFSGYVAQYYGEFSFEVDENGCFFYEATEDMYLDFEISDYNENAIEAEIEVVRNEKNYPVERKSPFDEENKLYISEDVDDGSYADGKWLSGKTYDNNDEQLNELDIGFILDAGYTVEIKPDGNFNGNAYINPYEAEYIELEKKDGVYTYTTDGELVEFEIILQDYNAEFTTEITVTKDGSAYEVSDTPALNNETKTYENIDVNDGDYKDGKWTPTYDENDEEYEIDVELRLYEGYVLTVEVSDGFDGEVALSDLDSSDIILEGEDGVYIYNAEEYIYPNLEITSQSDDFTVKIYVQETTTQLLEKQNTKTLVPSERGKYYAEIEFKDGTLLKTDIVEIASTVIFNTNGGTAIDTFTGVTLEEIEATERTGYIFEGWYTDEAMTMKASLPLKVTGVINLYAKWAKCYHRDSESKPTCTEDTVCTVCNAEYKAEGHYYNLYYTVVTDTHYLRCMVCDAKKNEGEHNYTEWTMTKYPERETEGAETRVCSVCAFAETRIVEELGGLSNGGIVGIITGSSALLSALAVGIWFILRKKFL